MMNGFRALRLGGVFGLGVCAGVVGCSHQPVGSLPLVAASEPAAPADTAPRSTPAAEYEQLLLVYSDVAASAHVVRACGVRDPGWALQIDTRVAAAAADDDRLGALRAALPAATVTEISADVARHAAASARFVADATARCRDLGDQPYVKRLDAVAYGTLDARDFYD